MFVFVCVERWEMGCFSFVLYAPKLLVSIFGNLTFWVACALFKRGSCAPPAETMSFADQAVNTTCAGRSISQHLNAPSRLHTGPSSNSHSLPTSHQDRNNVRTGILQDIPRRNRLAPREALLRLRLRRAHLPSNRRCTSKKHTHHIHYQTNTFSPSSPASPQATPSAPPPKPRKMRPPHSA